MKRVGILTIHNICNFGSVLQAYALSRTVTSLGFSAEIINYRYPNEYHISRRQNEKTTVISESKKDYYDSFADVWRARLYRMLFSKRDKREKKRKFDRFRDNYLKCSPLYPDMESLRAINGVYDIYLTGSDQVWNPRYVFDDLSFLFPFVDSENRIAFSASFGTKTLPSKYKELYKTHLEGYRFISTREKSGVGIVADICSKKAVCTCDPTLLLTRDNWSELIKGEPIVKGGYILCYILTYTANPYPWAQRLVEHIKDTLKLKVVCIGSPNKYWLHSGFIEINDCGPLDFLNLFYNASFVITCSFHGTAFSVSFKKDFYSILPPDVNDERQESFLNIVGAQDRILRVEDPMPNRDSIAIRNWDNISANLDEYTIKSKMFLFDALNGCH